MHTADAVSYCIISCIYKTMRRCFTLSNGVSFKTKLSPMDTLLHMSYTHCYMDTVLQTICGRHPWHTNRDYKQNYQPKDSSIFFMHAQVMSYASTHSLGAIHLIAELLRYCLQTCQTIVSPF